MRSVIKDLTAIPQCLTTEKALSDLQLIAQGSTDVEINDSIYKGTYRDENGKTQSAVRDALNLYYFEKCAYCEDFCKAEIEHYRPKKGVTGLPDHNGYFWLCYEWSNLLPSCRYCNTEGGKGNKFPLLSPGNRVYLPTLTDNQLVIPSCQANANFLLAERPLLLNPEIDEDFEEFFTFKINDNKTGIEIIGADDDKRGYNTVEICNLNRKVLQLNRLVIYSTYLSEINNIFEFNAKGILPPENIEKALFVVYRDLEKKASDVNEKFTLLKKLTLATVKNFTEIFSPYILNENQRTIAVAAFANYKNL